MTSSKAKKQISIDSFGRLIQIIHNDPDINKKVTAMLQLDPYQRRIILNNWLEQLRINKAPKNLLNALCSLFDDEVAEQVLSFIEKSHKQT